MRYMLFDRWGNPLGDLPYAIKAIRTRATDATDTLDITTIGEINKDERIVFKDSMGRWAEYLCQSTQTARAAGMPVTVAYCTGSIAELSRTYIEDKRNRKANAKACLTKALEGTRWAVGTVETGTITGTADLAFYHCTVLDAVQKTADTYGLEVQTEYQPDPTGNQIGRRIIHLVEHRGSTNTTKRFEYGKDLTQIKRDIDSGDVITRLYGWGKGIEQTNDQGEATGGYSRKISFADVTTFNLDEYRGLDPEHDQSYRYFMKKHLFDHVDIDQARTHVPEGFNPDADAVCAAYEEAIEAAGGIDLQLLGLGPNGHIGFNEPGAAFEKETHCVDLTESTIKANARFFETMDDVPKQAYTMGIKNIMTAKKILLVATGEAKADALYKSLYGPITPNVPASILQLHPDVTVVADEGALKLIREKGLL